MTGTNEHPDGPAVTPVGRRGFLASAALAAAPAPLAAAPAAAEPAEGATVAGPADEAAAAAGHRAVARLLAVAEGDRGIGWLRAALQVAVQLELTTIPPYLCGWWSVRDRRGEAARLIRRIVGDEMYHLGVVCNLLVAVGGRPRIRDAAPRYPCPLPGGVRAGVQVYLSGLTKAFVRDVMMAIEAPDTPLARTASSPPTIGDFYGELQRAFRRTEPYLSAEGQLSDRIGSDVLEPVTGLDDVERALEIVKEQGEGTESSPADAFQDDHPAHYYAFAEIYHGRRLRRTARGWQFTGAPVPFPDARPMASVPPGGWHRPPVRVGRLLDQFDTTYAAVLDRLDEAWGGGGGRSLGAAVRAMRGMEEPAVELMETPIPGAPGTYGPQFRPV
ncbi:ferritin-like domain-containing protein [Streptomyces durhamensis]|uniref:ferritin-like domain-containing protein n=1 Tax=Streptomyces durhamensis TaxID=68194 RepID=UPI000B17194B|nr:ferritin-like protein [Streptomyces durhamensis]